MKQDEIQFYQYLTWIYLTFPVDDLTYLDKLKGLRPSRRKTNNKRINIISDLHLILNTSYCFFKQFFNIHVTFYNI